MSFPTGMSHVFACVRAYSGVVSCYVTFLSFHIGDPCLCTTTNLGAKAFSTQRLGTACVSALMQACRRK